MTTRAKPPATATNADATIAEREQRVIEFFASWGESFQTFCDSFALLTEDCVWDQRPIPPRGQIVHVQRVDRLRRADGSLIVAAPVAGVLEFRGERVVAWREYFDLT